MYVVRTRAGSTRKKIKLGNRSRFVKGILEEDCCKDSHGSRGKRCEVRFPLKLKTMIFNLT